MLLMSNKERPVPVSFAIPNMHDVRVDEAADRPRLLFLDEITATLDAGSGSEAWNPVGEFPQVFPQGA